MKRDWNRWSSRFSFCSRVTTVKLTIVLLATRIWKLPLLINYKSLMIFSSRSFIVLICLIVLKMNEQIVSKNEHSVQPVTLKS